MGPEAGAGDRAGRGVPPAAIRAIRALLPQAAACGATATAGKHRAQRRLLRRGWAVPRSPTAAAWRAEHEPELDRDRPERGTSALARAQPAAAEAEALQAEIRRRRADRPARGWLWSLPGWGPGTAAVGWAGIGDPARFRHARPRARTAGWDPTVHPSGAADGRGPSSRPGPPARRRALVAAAGFAIRNPRRPLRAVFERRVGRVGRRRARVAVARTRLMAAWKVWREGRLAREGERQRDQNQRSAIRVALRRQPRFR